MSQAYGDIGYHYVIDRAGRIWEGRDDSYAGAHTLGYNHNIGIVVIGTYHGAGSLSLTSAQKQAIEDLAAWIIYRDGIWKTAIVGHRDHDTTFCPGDQIYDWLPTLRSLLNNRMGPCLGPICPESADPIVSDYSDEPLYTGHFPPTEALVTLAASVIDDVTSLLDGPSIGSIRTVRWLEAGEGMWEGEKRIPTEHMGDQVLEVLLSESKIPDAALTLPLHLEHQGIVAKLSFVPDDSMVALYIGFSANNAYGIPVGNDGPKTINR